MSKKDYYKKNKDIILIEQKNTIKIIKILYQKGQKNII